MGEGITVIDYTEWNFRQLQMECKRLNIPGNGTRAELMEKLQNTTGTEPAEATEAKAILAAPLGEEFPDILEDTEVEVVVDPELTVIVEDPVEDPVEDLAEEPKDQIRILGTENAAVKVAVPFTGPLDDLNMDQQRILVREKVIEMGYTPLGGLYAARYIGVGLDYSIYAIEVQPW